MRSYERGTRLPSIRTRLPGKWACFRCCALYFFYFSPFLWSRVEFGVAFLPLLHSTDLSVCCSGFHVHRRQLLPQAEPRLLHDHHLHPQFDDRHAVLGLLLALRGRRPRQNLTGHLDRPHDDHPDIHGRVLSAEGRALSRVLSPTGGH